MNWISRSIARRLYYRGSSPTGDGDGWGCLICSVIFFGIVAALAFNWI